MGVAGCSGPSVDVAWVSAPHDSSSVSLHLPVLVSSVDKSLPVAMVP